MSSSIQPLPSEVVALIAAGEVIDSLAAAVRELVENSLDAGATRIVISLWPEEWRLTVADNGCGMELSDLHQAATPHSTSKIRSCADLWQITSLGFRGEALHSLAQLSELEVLSRPTGSSESWRVVYGSGGEPRQVETSAIAPGTIVTVANLFGDWPVRRQGLPSLAQQMKLVQTTIQQIALCHPHVTWQVWQNDHQWFSLCPGASTQYLLPQILRQVKLSDLQYLKVEVPAEAAGGREFIQNPQFPPSGGCIQLVLGLPDRCHRHRPDWIRAAVNGRIVKSPELEQTILAATARTLPRDRYPICFLHLSIPPHQVNWNRHPAKGEMYLHQLAYWQTQVAGVIEQALRISSINLPEALHTTRVGQLIKAAEEQGAYSINRSLQPAPVDANHTQSSTNCHSLRAVAQVHHTYILAEHPSGLWLVEQHIAHERVLYEQLCDHWQLIALEPPVILNQLSPTQFAQLERIGLNVEPFGEQLWAVRTAPALLLTRKDCPEALIELSLGGDLQTAQVAVACRSAIRNGTPLSLDQMQTLLEQWQQTRNPRTCPHGRPIYLSLEESALSRFFRRHWVIGKSHGI